MNKYLSRLRSRSDAAKAVVSPSVRFGSAPGSRALENASSDVPGDFWPWAPYLCADDVARFRAELVGMIERLADVEHWPDEDRDDVLARAIRGPLGDLLPNITHFRERLDGALAATKARDAVAARSWRFDL